MLATQDVESMREFCDELHPARTAELLEGLEATEIWELLHHCDTAQRVDIFSYFDLDTQTAILEEAPRGEMAELVHLLPADDRVDILQDLDRTIANEIVALLPVEDRRDILRLQAFPEGTCGSVMTTDFVRLSENMTVDEAIREIGRQVRVKETVYYLYVLDEGDHLVGLVSAKQLLAAVGKGKTLIHELMERDLITVKAFEESREAAHDVAKYDFIAVPVVDDEHRMLGIITYDDVIDMNHEAATKHAYRMGAVAPLEEAYLEAPFLTVWKKRFFWLSCLFVAELFTFSALAHFQDEISQIIVLALFVPLCLSTGGNSGSQAATLITRSLAIGEVRLGDWFWVLRHELLMGLALGLSIGLIGFARAACTPHEVLGSVDRWLLALTIAQAVAMICLFGTLIGSMLPLVFKRMGADPAIASSPFVATFVDVTGITIYFTIAKFWLLSGVTLSPMVTLPAVSIEFALNEPTRENRLAIQEECHRSLSQLPGLKFFFTTDSATSPHAGEVLVAPTTPATRYQVACTLIFKDKSAYEKFVVSPALNQFLSAYGNHWEDRRVILYEIETPADAEH